MRVKIISLPFDYLTLAALGALAFLAGFVRGFSGFGAAMIYVPAASAIVGPKVAVIALWAMDTLPSLPIVLPALKKVSWRSVLPVMLGYAATVGLGVYWLTHGDPLVLRWATSACILVAVALLWSGWQFNGPRPFQLSIVVGGMSGILGGAAQLSGPPVLIYWLAGTEPSWLIRANIIVLFALTTVFSGLAFWANGLFAQEALVTALVCAPAYCIALAFGQHLFHGSSDALYRRVAFMLILGVAIVTLPVFDNVLR